MASQCFFAHGKLLLSGEYLVLKGAEALAVPTARGQSLKISPAAENIRWTSQTREGKTWFSVVFDPGLHILETSDKPTAGFLKRLLQAAQNLKGTPIPPAEVSTQLDFPRDWGLGSSSTLTYLIAHWLKIDPFRLFFATQNGSGYDIACAGGSKPILYQLKNQQAHWQKIKLPEAFRQVLFIHLNKKQESHREVGRFLQTGSHPKAASEITEITRAMTAVASPGELAELITAHENLMSTLLNTPPVKERLFKDYEGAVKSLGAWGGDFIMAIGGTPEYFKTKGFSTILTWDEMCLSESFQ